MPHPVPRGVIVSGGHNVRTFPPPTLKLRPAGEEAVEHLLGKRCVGRPPLRNHTPRAPAGSSRERSGIGVQPFEPVGAERARSFEQALVVDHVERRQRGGAADRALLVRVMAERESAATSRSSRAIRAAIGNTPPPSPLPSTSMSGTQSKCSQANIGPVRPRQSGSRRKSAARRAGRSGANARPVIRGRDSNVVQRIGSAMTAATSPCTSST